MIQQIDSSRTRQVLGQEAPVLRAQGSPNAVDELVSWRRQPPIFKLLQSVVQHILDWIKGYFLFCFFDPELDAEKEAVNNLELFFQRFLDAQADPNEENGKKIKEEWERLDEELQKRVKNALKKIIQEQVLPGKSVEEHRATFEKVLQDPFTVFDDQKGHEPCIMGIAIARAKESFNVIA